MQKKAIIKTIICRICKKEIEEDSFIYSKTSRDTENYFHKKCALEECMAKKNN